jgi:hypothetical protein
VDLEPNKDGDNTMQVTCADGSTIDVTIDLVAPRKLVEILQRRLFHWAQEAAKNLRFPQSVDVAVSRAGQGSQLMVSTTQIGWWVLLMSDDVLRKAQREVDRLSTWRFGPQASNNEDSSVAQDCAHGFRNSSGSFATLGAIRLASSRVRSLAGIQTLGLQNSPLNCSAKARAINRSEKHQR